MVLMSENELVELIQQAVKAAIDAVAVKDTYVSAEVLSERFELKKGKKVSASSLRRWPQLNQAKRLVNGNVLFNERIVYKIIENENKA